MRMPAGEGDKPMESHVYEAARRQSDKLIDPVCGMEIVPAKAAGKSEYQGQTYYFCSEQCKRDFDKNPAAVLKNTKG